RAAAAARQPVILKGWSMKDFIVSGVFLFFSVFTFIASQAFTRKGASAFSLAKNPALYPRIIAAILLILSGALLFQSVRKGALKNITMQIDREKMVKVSRLFLVVIVYIAGVYFAGYLISSAICLFLFALLYGGKVRSAIFCALGTTLALYLLFRIGFRIPLPVGRFFV
ncbi:MAG: tripartite tricarboxylate transporter TctB family protein, partial [Spirochaetaceae bacterium]|nr:tripartite tricarboxylate transporter TctB family protein [Spirochaetaceae bacterium]